jgi:hypothetical protein
MTLHWPHQLHVATEWRDLIPDVAEEHSERADNWEVQFMMAPVTLDSGGHDFFNLRSIQSESAKRRAAPANLRHQPQVSTQSFTIGGNLTKGGNSIT